MMKHKSRLTYIGGALAAIALIGIGVAQVANDAGSPSRPDIELSGDMSRLTVLDKSRPVSDQTFVDPSGEEAKFADLTGQPIVANFWATWCAPCREEMPSLSRLQEAMKDEPLRVITIASGPTPDSAIHGFMDEIGVDNLPLYRDPSQTLSRAMGVLALPVTVLISAEGKEVARFIGDTEWDSEEAQAAIAALLLPPR